MEHSKSYGKSFMYNYKIDHSKGSVVELFFTGDALDENTKQTIYQTAARYNIKQEQICINDHTTTEDVSDNELVREIYNRMDQEIAMRDNEIKRLTAELEAQQHNDIPYSQIAREIKATYPSINEVHITCGEHIADTDTENHQHSTIVAIVASRRLVDSDKNKLQEWLKVRLNSENLILIDLS